jgi:hypothetical protein
MTEITFALAAMLLLGAFHGLNPGMGWLFAVALGLQERRSGAVWAALLPLALGHALAIAVAVLAIALVGSVIPLGALKWGVAGSLLELAIWSFLMATAHGAGLMVLPFVVDATSTTAAATGGAVRTEEVRSTRATPDEKDAGMRPQERHHPDHAVKPVVAEQPVSKWASAAHPTPSKDGSDEVARHAGAGHHHGAMHEGPAHHVASLASEVPSATYSRWGSARWWCTRSSASAS